MINRRGKHSVTPYPYIGTFSRKTEYPEGVPLDQIDADEEEEVVLVTCCDIQPGGNADKPLLYSFSSVFIPWEKEKGLVPIKRGMSFKATANGVEISGTVQSVSYSQLESVVVQVKDYDVD